MTVFLVAVPRNRDSASTADLRVSEIVEQYSELLGPRYKQAPIVRSPMSNSGAVLVEWHAGGESNAIRISKSWAISTRSGISLRIIRSIDTECGKLRLKNPVWGSYATVNGRYDSDRMFAWATVPGIEAIHYAVDSDAIYFSNRPLAVAAAFSRNNLSNIELSEQYLREYLSLGFSISGVSPFAGVNTVPSDYALSIYQGEYAVVPAPSQPSAGIDESTDPETRGADELLDALRSATRRNVETLGDQPIQLRLSGGKDSRLMLGLLLDAGVTDVVGVTQGDETSQEVLVANELAQLAGIEHKAVYPPLASPRSVSGSVDQTIRDSQGMLLSEAIGMPYAFADPIQIGEGYAAGQWPTFKAPYVRKSLHSLEDLDKEWHAHTADNLAPGLYEDTNKMYRQWVASVPSIPNNDILYLYGRNVRASNYMHASSIAIDSYSQIFFPFVDSEVTTVADVLPNAVRRSEVALFLALRKLWPEALSVPFARGGKFRFERDGYVQGLSGDDYALRTADPKPRSLDILNASYLDAATDRELLDSPLKEGSKYLLMASSWEYLRTFVSSDFAALLEKMADSLTEHDNLIMLRTRRRRILTRVSIWRLIAAEAWLSKRWLRA